MGYASRMLPGGYNKSYLGVNCSEDFISKDQVPMYKLT